MWHVEVLGAAKEYLRAQEVVAGKRFAVDGMAWKTGRPEIKEEYDAKTAELDAQERKNWAHFVERCEGAVRCAGVGTYTGEGEPGPV